MAKSPRVTFKMERIAEDDWQIIAECPKCWGRSISIESDRPTSYRKAKVPKIKSPIGSGESLVAIGPGEPFIVKMTDEVELGQWANLRADFRRCIRSPSRG